jgi:hypothetical protein
MALTLALLALAATTLADTTPRLVKDIFLRRTEHDARVIGETFVANGVTFFTVIRRHVWPRGGHVGPVGQPGPHRRPGCGATRRTAGAPGRWTAGPSLTGRVTSPYRQIARFSGERGKA